MLKALNPVHPSTCLVPAEEAQKENAGAPQSRHLKAQTPRRQALHEPAALLLQLHLMLHLVQASQAFSQLLTDVNLIFQ